MRPLYRAARPKTDDGSMRQRNRLVGNRTEVVARIAKADAKRKRKSARRLTLEQRARVKAGTPAILALLRAGDEHERR